MQDEINFGDYLSLLVRRWWLIVIGIILGAIIAVIANRLIPATYQATTVLSGTPVASLVDLALSDATLEPTLQKLNSSVPGESAQLTALRSRLIAAAVPGSLTNVQLIVTDNDANRAALIANIWADSVLEQVTTLASENDVPQLQAQLNAHLSLLSNISSSRSNIDWHIKDADALHQQLAQHNLNEAALLEDQVLIVGLSAQIIEAPSVQFQLSDFKGQSVGDQIRYLDRLTEFLSFRRQILQEREDALLSKIHALQAQIMEAQTKGTAPSAVQILRRADTPASATQSISRTSFLGATIGLILAIGTVLIWEWWVSKRLSTSPNPPSAVARP